MVLPLLLLFPVSGLSLLLTETVFAQCVLRLLTTIFFWQAQKPAWFTSMKKVSLKRAALARVRSSGLTLKKGNSIMTKSSKTCSLAVQIGGNGLAVLASWMTLLLKAMASPAHLTSLMTLKKLKCAAVNTQLAGHWKIWNFCSSLWQKAARKPPVQWVMTRHLRCFQTVIAACIISSVRTSLR